MKNNERTTHGIVHACFSGLRSFAALSHLHSDHTTGYPDLILTPWVMVS